MQDVTGDAFEQIYFFHSVSAKVTERLYAVKYTLEIYDTISCKADCEKVKSIVKDEPEMNAYLMNSDADDILGILTRVKIPATTQMALKMKDDIRKRTANQGREWLSTT